MQSPEASMHCLRRLFCHLQQLILHCRHRTLVTIHFPIGCIYTMFMNLAAAAKVNLFVCSASELSCWATALCTDLSMCQLRSLCQLHYILGVNGSSAHRTSKMHKYYTAVLEGPGQQ